MVNRERFMLDVDSEGFPLQDTTMASYNLTVERTHSAASAALLADVKCMRCANPLGWVEVDGVVLPRITWDDFSTLADGSPVPAEADYTDTEQRIALHGALNGTLGFGS